MSSNRAHDIYRPDYSTRDGEHSKHGRDSVSMFWRKDRVDERRRTIEENDIFRTEAESIHAPASSRTIVSKRERARSNSAASAARREVLGVLSFPHIPVRSVTASGAYSLPATPKISTRPPSRGLSEIDHFVRAASGELTATDDNGPAKTTDPRLRLQSQKMTHLDIETSPEPSSSDEEQSDRSLLFKELSRITLHRAEILTEHKETLNQLNKHKDDLRLSKRLFMGKSNAYTERLGEDICSLETAYQAKKVQLNEAISREKSILDNLFIANTSHSMPDTEIRDIRAQLQEERNLSKQLRASNEHLQKQTDRLELAVSSLTHKVAQEQHRHQQVDFQPQIDELKELVQPPVKPSSDEDIRSLREQLSSQKLAIARLNDVFATQDSTNELATKIDKLFEEQSSTSKQLSGGYITQTHLDDYIAVFNNFEKRTVDRIVDLENKSLVTHTDLEPYTKSEDLIQHVRDLEAEKAAHARTNDKLAGLEERLHLSIEKIKKLENTIGIHAQKSSDLVPQIRSLQLAYQHLKTTADSPPDGAKLQQSIAALQTTLQQLEYIAKANTHAIVVLNQRFSNVTTDQLVRQMACAIEPTLANIKPQISDIQAQLQRVEARSVVTPEMLANTDTHVNELLAAIGQIERSHNDFVLRLARLDTQMDGLGNNVSKVAIMEEKLQAVEMEMNEFSTANAELMEKARADLHNFVTPIKDTVEIKIRDGLDSASKKTDVALAKAKEEQDTSYRILVEEVKQARDHLDARLEKVEKQLLEPSSRATLATQTRHPNTTHTSPTQASDQKTDLPGPASQANITCTNLKISEVKDTCTQSKPSKPKPTKIQLSRKLPIARHFQSQSDSDSVDDTIDATPRPSAETNKFKHGKDIITISESDQDLGGSDLEIPNLEMWKKQPQTDQSLVKKSSAKQGASAGVDRDRSASLAGTLRTKRKRESSSVVSKHERDGNDNMASNPRHRRRKKLL